MAKMTPKQLRARARALLEKAEEEENKAYIRVGKLIKSELLSPQFKPEELPLLKKKILEILQ